jgi:site-specific DNA recombinase
VRVDQLDGYVWDSVKSLLEDPDRVLTEWTRRGSVDGTVSELRARRDEAQKLVTAQERTLKRLLDAYEAGALDLSDLTDRTARVRARTRAAAEELAHAQADLAQTVEINVVAGRLGDFAAQMRNGIDRLDWQQRRHLVRTLVARVEIDEGGATVVYRVPPASGGGSSSGTPEAGGDGGKDAQEQFYQLRGRGDFSDAGEHLPARGAG